MEKIGKKNGCLAYLKEFKYYPAKKEIERGTHRLASHLKRDKHAEVDLPGFTTAMDGGSAGAVGSGSSKNLEALSRVKLIAHRLDGFARIFLLPA
ncbi:MAG: hypothetical protein Q8S52_14465, partial [Methylobacter sp.]|nr:hypothetical protein [Methylobacter sp.]